MIRKILLVVVFILLILVIGYYPLITYGIKQGIGQLTIVWNARPIEEVKEDITVPDSIKASLDYVREVVEFGVDKVGLRDKGNYQSYYDQKGQPLLFLVIGAEPFALKSYEWKFPVVGVMPYKGFFDSEDADRELARLQELGYDGYIRNPGGWSTLGWFNDPVLSGMLARSRGNLTNTILHELTHATIFVKDSVEYNENLATFIGDEATLLFLKVKFGEGSPEWTIYNEEEQDYELFVDHILRGADKLDSLYSNFIALPNEEKLVLKNNLIKEILITTDTIDFNHPEKYIWNKDILPNNAYFMSFLRYRSRQDDFDEILAQGFNGSLVSYVAHLKKLYN